MASETLIRQAEKMYGSMADTTDYAKLLTQPFVDEMNKNLEAQKLKTEALIATMPAGVNIAKVPEELRGQVTSYLTENKAAYVEASKVIASGIKATDPRYLEAMEKMNEIRGGFEALDANLVKLAENRKLSLDNKDNISLFASDGDGELQHKFANGSIYGELTLRDGSFYYKNKAGEEINSSDYALGAQQQTGIVDSMHPLQNLSVQDKRAGDEFREGYYRDVIKSNLKKAGKNGRGDFAYGGMVGDDSGQTRFINKYIAEQHGVTEEDNPKEFKRFYESYKEADFGAGTELGKRLEDYLLNTLRASYDGAKTTVTGNEYKPGNYIIGGREIRPETFNRMYKPHVDILNKGTTGEDEGNPIIRKAPNGIRYRGSDDKGWEISTGGEAFEKATKSDIANSIGFDESHGVDFAIIGGKADTNQTAVEPLNLTSYFKHEGELPIRVEEQFRDKLGADYPELRVDSPVDTDWEMITVNGEKFYLDGGPDSTPAAEMKRLQKILDEIEKEREYNPDEE